MSLYTTEASFAFDRSFNSLKRFGISNESNFLENAIGQIGLNIRYFDLLKRQSSIFENSRYLTEFLVRSPNREFASEEIVVQPQLLDVQCGAQKRIIRLHDLFPITDPKWFTCSQRILFRKAFERLNLASTRFIANSEYTRSTGVKLGIPKENIKVVPCFVAIKRYLPCKSCKACMSKNQLAPYAVAVGTIEPRKNYPELIEFWNRLPSDYPELFIIGREGWGPKLVQEKIGSVTLLGYICDYQVQQFYKNAKVFVSNSFSEGFNIPLHEASIFGLQIVATDIEVNLEKSIQMSKFQIGDFQSFMGAVDNALSGKPNKPRTVSASLQINKMANVIREFCVN